MEMRNFSGGDALAALMIRQQYSENRATRRRQEQLRRKLEKASKKAVQKQPQPGPTGPRPAPPPAPPRPTQAEIDEINRACMYAIKDAYLYSYSTTCTKAGLGS